MQGNRQPRSLFHTFTIIVISMSLAACLEEEEKLLADEQQAVAGDVNSAPVISGTASLELTAGETYSFTPTVSDADDDALSFTVAGLPSWASFDSGTGRIIGTPQEGDIGTYTGITITVSDGQAEDTLGPFTVTVQAVALGSVTLSWVAPTQNEDGTTLTDLDGYTIYWGTQPGSYPNSVTIDNESITTYVVDNLSPGSYEFVATSFNSSGVESAYSDPATRVVQ